MSDGAGTEEAADATPRFFAVRVMKTGTGTLVQHAINNVGERGIYPAGGIDDVPGEIRSAVRIPYLLNLSSKRRAEIRVYVGHFPYIAYQKLGIDCVTLTILRDPVARTISHLAHAKHEPRFRDTPFEEIYEDPFTYPFFMHNHQAKYFGMTEADPLTSVMDVVEIDDERLTLAKHNLEQIDVVGLTERYDEFLDVLRQRFAWSIRPGIAANVSSEKWVPNAAFRRKIEADNEADIELYEYARKLYEQRRRSRA
jgi:hypothetical protein